MFITFKDGTKIDIIRANETYFAGRNNVVTISLNGNGRTVKDVAAMLTDDNVGVITLTSDSGKEYVFNGLYLQSVDRYFDKEDAEITIVLTDVIETE